MRITIDTQADSHEEIRKAIKLLHSIIGESKVYSNEPVKNIFDSPSPSVGNPEPQPTNAFADMFSGSLNAAESSPSSENLTSQQLLDEKEEPKETKDEVVEFY